MKPESYYPTTIDIAEKSGEYASKWGLTDFYPEAEEILRGLIDSGEDFETDWFGCKKEIRYAKITRSQDETEVQVTAHMDDLYESDDLIYDALWEVSKIEDELPEEIIDSIREAAYYDVDDHTETFVSLPRSATFDEIVRAMEHLEYEAEASNHRMYLELCDIVKAHVEYMNSSLTEDKEA